MVTRGALTLASIIVVSLFGVSTACSVYTEELLAQIEDDVVEPNEDDEPPINFDDDADDADDADDDVEPDGPNAGGSTGGGGASADDDAMDDMPADDDSGGAGTGGSDTPPPQGGTDGNAGEGGSGGDPTGTPVSLDDWVIDNFEDKNSSLPRLEGRSGFWFAEGNSADEGGSITPFAVTELMMPRGDSKQAVHIVAQGYATEDTWAVFGVNFNDKQAYPGAAEYIGIRFWAKHGSSTESEVVRMELPTTDTSSEHGGDDDNFGVLLALDPDWMLYTILWDASELQQQGWGVTQTFEPANLMAIQFKLNSPETGFDVWLDDVEFVSMSMLPDAG